MVKAEKKRYTCSYCENKVHKSGPHTNGTIAIYCPFCKAHGHIKEGQTVYKTVCLLCPLCGKGASKNGKDHTGTPIWLCRHCHGYGIIQNGVLSKRGMAKNLREHIIDKLQNKVKLKQLLDEYPNNKELVIKYAEDYVRKLKLKDLAIYY